MLKRFIIAGVLWLACIAPAHALSQQDAPMMRPEVRPLPEAKEGIVPWKLFNTTKEQQKKNSFPDGSYSFDVTPIFSDDMKALGGKEVRLHGFMFPLEQSEKQKMFLLGPYPPSCPFHYHVGPTLIVEVRTKKPIAFSWDEVTFKGTLELAEKDPNGVYYYLKNAELISN